MGACQSSNANKSKKTRAKLSNISKVQDADVESSFNHGYINQLNHKSNKNDLNFLQTIISTNDIDKLQKLISNNELPLNDYIFSNKTVLHFAVQRANTSTVELLLLNGSNVDKPELETGNTALFLAALDLNLEMVVCLLKFNPNIGVVNKSNQNVINLLENTFVAGISDSNREVTTHFVKKSALTVEEKNKLDSIFSLLNNASYKQTNVETFETEPKNKKMEASFDNDNKQVYSNGNFEVEYL